MLFDDPLVTITVGWTILQSDQGTFNMQPLNMLSVC